MRFFTIDWWAGSATSDPFEAYEQHLEELGALPESLELLTTPEHSLHDARLLHMRVDIEASTARLELAGCAPDGGRRDYVVMLRGVSAIDTRSDPATGLPGPHGYGDLGYLEIDRTPDGGLHVLRALFSTGIELEFRFEELVFEFEDEQPPM